MYADDLPLYTSAISVSEITAKLNKYCSIVWSSATYRDLGTLQLAQNRAARLALKCTQIAKINNMHVHLSLLKVEERLFL